MPRTLQDYVSDSGGRGQVAPAIDCHEVSLGSWCRGKMPSDRMAKRLADYFGITVPVLRAAIEAGRQKSTPGRASGTLNSAGQRHSDMAPARSAAEKASPSG